MCTLLLAGMIAAPSQSLPESASSRTVLDRLSEAVPGVQWDAKSGLRADLDCDGRADQAFLGRNAGRVYVGLVRAAATKPEILDFAVDAGSQKRSAQSRPSLWLSRLTTIRQRLLARSTVSGDHERAKDLG